MKKLKGLPLLLMLLSGLAQASATRITEADSLISADKTKSYALPTATTTLVGTDSTQTLTNKTLTSPVISTISNSGTVTLPTGTRTLVARDTTDTLTNKTMDGASNTFTNLPASALKLGRTLNAQTGTTYTFVLTDGSDAGGNTLVTASNASAQTYTVPPNSSVAFPTGTQIDLLNDGAGTVTIAAGAGVTINAVNGLTVVSGTGASLEKLATNTWRLLQGSAGGGSAAAVISINSSGESHVSAEWDGGTVDTACTGTCTVRNSTGGITSVTRTGTGRYSIALSAGSCTARWKCDFDGYDAPNVNPVGCSRFDQNGVPSTTFFAIRCIDSGGTDRDSTGNISCYCNK